MIYDSKIRWFVLQINDIASPVTSVLEGGSVEAGITSSYKQKNSLINVFEKYLKSQIPQEDYQILEFPLQPSSEKDDDKDIDKVVKILKENLVLGNAGLIVMLAAATSKSLAKLLGRKDILRLLTLQSVIWCDDKISDLNKVVKNIYNKSTDPEMYLYLCLGLAILTHLRGKKSLIITQRPELNEDGQELEEAGEDEGQYQIVSPQYVFNSEHVKHESLGFDFQHDLHIEFVENEDQLMRLLLSAISGELFDVHPRLGDVEESKFISNTTISKKTNGYARIPQEHYYYDIFRQEFGSRKIVRKFVELCRNTIARQPPNRAEKAEALLPLEILHAIGAARLCRRMANWTLEGEPFQCSVVLFTVVDWDRPRSRFFRSVIECDQPIPFNFSHLDQIRKLAETAQGRDIMLFVSVEDGLLRGTCVREGVHHFGDSRLQAYTRLSNLGKTGPEDPHPIILHCREPGFVEIFAKGSFKFWHDGFRWIANPYAKLTKVIKKFLTLENDESEEFRVRATERLVGAIAELQDRRKSSIIVLTHKLDSHLVEQFAGTQLRPGYTLGPHSSYLAVDAMSCDVLTALFQLDGANFIDSSGKIAQFSRQIRGFNQRHVIEFANNDVDVKEILEILVKDKPKNIKSEFSLFCDRLKDVFSKYGLFEDYILEIGDASASIIASHYIPREKIKSWKDSAATEDVDGKILKMIGTKLDEEILTELNVASKKSLECAAKYYSRVFDKTNILFVPDQSDPAKRQAAEKNIPTGSLQYGYIIELHLEYNSRKVYLDEIADWLKQQPGIWLNTDKNRWTMFVEENQFVRHVWQPNSKFPPGAYKSLRAVYDEGRKETGRAPGTGARAAESLAKQMPNSAVIKVSASGMLTIKLGKLLEAKMNEEKKEGDSN
jgi:hypothetical protein